MKKKFFLILFCLFGFLFSEAQIFEPVHWNISHKLTGKTTADIIFKASIDDGWHLYGLSLPPNGPKPTSIVFEKIEHAQKVGNLQAASKLEKKFDSNFGMELSWYSKEAVFVQKISFSSIKNVRLEGYIEYMACNDKSCLPPTTEPFSIQLNSKEISSVVADKNTTVSSSEKIQPTEDFKNANQVELSSEDNAEISASQWWTPVIKELNNFGNVAADKETASLWYVLLAGLLGGFLALLTPCVWPIIPMTVSFFLKRSAVPSRGRKDAVLYGLSIIVIYVVLGLLITLIFGASALNSMSTNALFNLFFFILLVVFALSFFGAFELTLPSSWSTKVDAKAESTVGLLSILLMAFTLVLVSFSCTGPIIGTLLVEVAASGSLLAPAIGMFGFSFALAVPFTLFAFFPSWLESLPPLRRLAQQRKSGAGIP
jgi:thiol:disulfide interchange protein DsbD